MSSRSLVLPVPRGAYAERADPTTGRLDRVLADTMGRLRAMAVARARRWSRFAALVRAPAELEVGDLGVAAAGLRHELRRHGFRDDLVARAFALVREAAHRTIGQRHFDVQLIGGRVLLAGMVAEMDTGEGKTLTATLAATTAALAGIPVHVVTVNDYLARRDADWMGPVYRALGLSVGVVVHGMDSEARRAAYRSDVAYCTNKELVFDYLRDRIVLTGDPTRVQLQLERLYNGSARAERLILRGLHFAIVDEADSVLVDEARTPLIIAGASDGSTARPVFEQALTLAEALRPEADFVVEERERAVRLTDRGRARLEELVRPLHGLWSGRQRREDLVRQALTARHIFHRDRQYVVVDGKVQIVDEFTGRVMADRSWEQGLHQMIEVKEGCRITGRQESRARISYQRFFRRYMRLAGMTGTAREVARELWQVYRLHVVAIPPNRRMIRRTLPDTICATADEKWTATVRRITELHADGRPVLIGTRSVAASEHLSVLLTAAGLTHSILNARQDSEEAAIVARAGVRGQITVATNMAGRGTDIVLGPGVAERGGLHVIATERHEAGRIDRQLFGRCGRQGDPGSCEAIVSLEDELVAVYSPGWRRAALAAMRLCRPLARPVARFAVRCGQRVAERVHARMRRDLLQMDERRESTLAFSGRAE